MKEPLDTGDPNFESSPSFLSPQDIARMVSMEGQIIKALEQVTGHDENGFTHRRGMLLSNHHPPQSKYVEDSVTVKISPDSGYEADAGEGLIRLEAEDLQFEHYYKDDEELAKIVGVSVNSRLAIGIHNDDLTRERMKLFLEEHPANRSHVQTAYFISSQSEKVGKLVALPEEFVDPRPRVKIRGTSGYSYVKSLLNPGDISLIFAGLNVINTKLTSTTKPDSNTKSPNNK